MSTYIWCEDSGSGYRFWKEIFAMLCPGFIVETKTNNSKLRKAATSISEDGNDYYIIMDMAVDNPDIIREAKRLIQDVSDKPNVHLIKIHSFEFALLSFEKLEQWVFAEEDELKSSRSGLLQAREVLMKILLHGGTSDDLQALKHQAGESLRHNTEQLSSKLLYSITRNTGFETNKSVLGQCFVNNCCEWRTRHNDDICGLDDRRLTAGEKKKQLVQYSVLENAFREAGLYDNGI